MLRVLTLLVVTSLLSGCLHYGPRKLPTPPPEFRASGVYVVPLDPIEHPYQHVVRLLEQVHIARENVLVTDGCQNLEFKPGDKINLMVTPSLDKTHDFRVDCEGVPTN